MPYTIRTTSVRPTADTPLFTDTMLFAQPLLYNEPGFVSSSTQVSMDGLTVVQTATWATQQDAESFRATDPRMLTPSFAAAQLAYNTSHHITVMVEEYPGQ